MSTSRTWAPLAAPDCFVANCARRNDDSGGAHLPLLLLRPLVQRADLDTAVLFDEIEISAGRVGVGVLVAVDPLVAVLNGTLADLTI